MAIRNYKRYLIEFVLVFLSVVGAFVFEDWRVKKENDNIYLSILKEFHFDLKQNVQDFIFEVDSVDDIPFSGRRLRSRQNVDKVLKAYSETDLDEFLIRTIMYFGVAGSLWSGDDQPSVQYKSIIEDHYHRIRNKQFKHEILEYGKAFDFRQKIIQSERRYFRKIEQDVLDNFEIPPSIDTIFFVHYFTDSNLVSRPKYAVLLTERNKRLMNQMKFRLYNSIKELHLNTDYMIGVHRRWIDGTFKELDSLVMLELNSW